MPWMRLNPAVVVQQLRAEHGPGDEDTAEQALAHLRNGLLSGVYVAPLRCQVDGSRLRRSVVREDEGIWGEAASYMEIKRRDGSTRALILREYRQVAEAA